jgi:cytochrome c oxidase cbb3-type subunit 2
MSLRNFILGLVATFGAAWLAMVVVPYLKMRSLEPVPLAEPVGTSTVFHPKRTGRIANGADVYAANGCALCHTQVVRPTYAGNDLYRADWGGLKEDADRGDTRRETNAYDFEGEKFAQIGSTRLGPDLSNLGRRLESRHASFTEASRWLYLHLYDPKLDRERWDSTCPPHRFLFDEREVKGQPSPDALPVAAGEGKQIVPGSDARALVSYLFSLRKDHPLPAALDFAPAKPAAEE